MTFACGTSSNEKTGAAEAVLVLTFLAANSSNPKNRQPVSTMLLQWLTVAFFIHGQRLQNA